MVPPMEDRYVVLKQNESYYVADISERVMRLVEGLGHLDEIEAHSLADAFNRRESGDVGRLAGTSAD